MARRSRSPCLFIPPGSGAPRKVLGELDGSDRVINVLSQACHFVRHAGAAVEAVTVERRPDGEPLQLVSPLPMGRSAVLRVRVRQVLTGEGASQLKQFLVLLTWLYLGNG